jgi:predicted acetyltransferase
MPLLKGVHYDESSAAQSTVQISSWATLRIGSISREITVNVYVSKPAIALQAGFLQMLDDYDEHDPGNGRSYASARSDFVGYVQSLGDDERGLVGVTPCSHRWLVDSEGAVIGVVRVRHRLSTDFLAREVGHIGYDVAPSQRGRGMGVVALNAGLEHARELGLTEVVLYADTDNPASWRTIEHCGGILESEHVSPYYQCLVRRYRIILKST